MPKGVTTSTVLDAMVKSISGMTFSLAISGYPALMS